MITYSDFVKDLETFGLERFKRFYGVAYRAIVEDNEDPDMLARIKVSLPELTGVSVLDKWIFPIAMFAGQGFGFVAVPKVGQNVWVAFRSGDPRFPLYLGSLWSKDQLPEEAKEDYPNTTVLKTEAGHFIKINDVTGEISLNQSNGNRVTINEDSIEVSVEGGANVVVNKTIVELNGNEQSALKGNITQTELNKANARLEAIANSMSAWVPIPGDGGLALKTLITAALIGTTPANYADVLSTKVKLD